MNKKLTRGFTLIELLVVIAIIAILAGVVLAALGTARSKASDTAVQANLANSRAQAELAYSSNANSYSGICNSNVAFNQLIDAAITASGGTVPTYVNTAAAAFDSGQCHDAQGAWVAQAALTDSVTATPSMWCVDSTGVSKASASVIGAGDTVCP